MTPRGRLKSRHLGMVNWLRQSGDPPKTDETISTTKSNSTTKRDASRDPSVVLRTSKSKDALLGNLEENRQNISGEATYKQRCNQALEMAGQLAVDKAKAKHAAKMLALEKERLCHAWRARRAKRTVLESVSKNDDWLKSHLGEAPPPIPRTIKDLEEITECPKKSKESTITQSTVDESVEPHDGLSRENSEIRFQTVTPDNMIELAGKSASTIMDAQAAAKKRVKEQRDSMFQKGQISVQNFLSRQPSRNNPPRNIYSLDSWKKYHNTDSKVFSIIGGYADLKEALLYRGWVENTCAESRFFDFKWTLKAIDIVYDVLDDHQMVNHYVKNRELTTKVGLTTNLRQNLIDDESESFYPRSFDLRDPSDRGDFLLDYILTKSRSVVVLFHQVARQVERHPTHKMTFSEDIIRLCLSICKRGLQDIHDIIDNPSLADSAWSISLAEWNVLRNICLDDASVWEDEDPNDYVMTFLKDLKENSGVTRELKDQRVAAQREKEYNPLSGAGPRDGNGGVLSWGPSPVEKKKKKKKKSEQEWNITGPCAQPLQEFLDNKIGQHLAKEANWVCHEMCMDEIGGAEVWNSLQYGKNAWIIKPAAKSRGRGIEMLRNLKTILKRTDGEENQWICQKYIEQPQLIHGYKFDIRQWVLVVDWNPLTVYIWQQPYLRFAGLKYDENLRDHSDLMHLVNNSVVKKTSDFKSWNDDLQTDGYMWFYQRYQRWLHDTYCRNDVHCTKFIHEPPYTCGKMGINFDKVKFVQREEDEDSDPGSPKRHIVSPSKTRGASSPPTKRTVSCTVNNLNFNSNPNNQNNCNPPMSSTHTTGARDFMMPRPRDFSPLRAGETGSTFSKIRDAARTHVASSRAKSTPHSSIVGGLMQKPLSVTRQGSRSPTKSSQSTTRTSTTGIVYNHLINSERTPASASTTKTKDESIRTPSTSSGVGSPSSHGSSPLLGSSINNSTHPQIMQRSCIFPTFSESEESEPEFGPDPEACEDIWSERIVPQMEDIILKSLSCVRDNVDHRKKSFELYGYDFMVSDANHKVWLIEVNSSPAMDYSTKVTCPLVKAVMEETCKLMFDGDSWCKGESRQWKKLKKGDHIPMPQRNIGNFEVLGTKMTIRQTKKKKKKKAKVASKENSTCGNEKEKDKKT